MHAMRRVGVELVGMYESGKVDAERVTRLLERLERQSLELDVHFPAGSSSRDHSSSKALPLVWQQPREFAVMLRAFQLSARGLRERSANTKATELWPAIAATGDLCTACHVTFRLGGDPPHSLD
jgi:cytochrome c556